MGPSYLTEKITPTVAGTTAAESSGEPTKANHQQLPTMKRISKSNHRPGLTFGDLVLAVSSFSRNSNETAAAVADLLESGRVRLTNNGRIIRARVS